MKNNPHRNFGFTLLEVMVAVAILSISLIAIYNTQMSSIRLFTSSDNVTTASYLAAIKMNELDLGFKGKFFGEIPAADKGDFKDLGYEEYKWELTFGPDALLEKLGAAFAPKEGDKNSQLSQMAGMVGLQPQVIGDTLSKSIKKLSIKVTWNTVTDNGEITLWEHYLDRDPNFQCIPGLPDGPTPDTGGAVAPAVPNTAIPGQNPTNSQNPVPNSPTNSSPGNTGFVPPQLPVGGNP